MHRSIRSTRPHLAIVLLTVGLAYTAEIRPALAQTQQNSAATGAAGATAASAAAPSDATKKAARAAYSDGQRAFEGGDYAAAVTHFSKANELIPSPHAQYWIALAQDKQGKTPEAYTAYTAFFAHPGHTALGEEKLKTAQARLTELSAIPANVRVSTEPPDASLTVDGSAQVGVSPFAIKLTAGKHQLKATAKGYQDQSREVEVQPGQSLEQSFALAPAPVAAPTPKPAAAAKTSTAPAAATERNMVPAYVTLGVAGAAAIAGTIFGIQALGAKSDFDKNPTEKNADSVERNGLIADMAFGVAITLGVTGVVLLTSSDEPSETAQRPAPKVSRLIVAPYASPKGGGAAAQIKF
jgi:hypothetical protein